VATATKFASSNAVVTTGWTNPTNAYADDGTYATAVPAKSLSVTTDYGFAAFTTGDIPTGSIINSVTTELQYKSDTTASTGALIGLQLNNGGTLLGTETTFAMNLADQTVTKQATTGVTLANLQSAGTVKARVRGFRSTSNTAVTWSADYVKLTVDYSLAATGTATLTLALTATGAATVAVQGAAGLTLVVTGAGTGAVAVQGAGTLTLVLTATAAGAVAVQGAGSATLALTVSGAGTVQSSGVTGSASLTLVPTVTAAGVVAVLGAGTATLALTAMGTGVVVVSGAAALTLGLTAAGVGVVAIRGSGAPLLPLTVQAAGVVAVQGAASLVLALTATGTATGPGGGAWMGMGTFCHRRRGRTRRPRR